MFLLKLKAIVTQRTFPAPTLWYLFSKSFVTGSSSTYVTKQNPRLSFVLLSTGSSMFSIYIEKGKMVSYLVTTDFSNMEQHVCEIEQIIHKTCISKGSKIFPNLFLCCFWTKTSNKDFFGRLLPLYGFGSFWINQFTIQFVLLQLQNLKIQSCVLKC